MHEVIVVWSRELLQQLSDVMIAGESLTPPPGADWTRHSLLGLINQDINLCPGTVSPLCKYIE